MSQKMDAIQKIIGETVVKLCEKKVPVSKDSISEKLLRVIHKDSADSEKGRIATSALEFLAQTEVKS
ncbi:hypothetical protein LPW36_16905 [Jinshanibacter sp. LJY008]|uniref:Uncharacterized protein n=1 Tax=Limnobaculum eriocheiris TaxID=2897391 RepID=A0A9X1SMV3_9GAMM|nr:hypothetical protein [Limnobaculum eriocheiris]MCD1127639.1 hypothetical protein [Limnobaculum eriocheiris]